MLLPVLCVACTDAPFLYLLEYATVDTDLMAENTHVEPTERSIAPHRGRTHMHASMGPRGRRAVARLAPVAVRVTGGVCVGRVPCRVSCGVRASFESAWARHGRAVALRYNM